MQNYQQLEIWKESVEVVRETYRLAEQLPKVKEFGMTSHMMTTALSIPVNITKSTRGRNPKEFLTFLENALESAYYLQIYVMLIRELLWNDSMRNELEIRLVSFISLLHKEIKLTQSFIK